MRNQPKKQVWKKQVSLRKGGAHEQIHGTPEYAKFSRGGSCASRRMTDLCCNVFAANGIKIATLMGGKRGTDCHDQSADWSRNDVEVLDCKKDTERATGSNDYRPVEQELSAAIVRRTNFIRRAEASDRSRGP